jgi:hypothetical protein
VGLLPLMYIMCSLRLVLIDLPDCPTYTFLHVLQFILNTPGGSLFLVFCESCWNIVFVVLKAVFRLVFLNRLVTLYIAGLWKVILIHVFGCDYCFVFVCFGYY